MAVYDFHKGFNKQNCDRLVLYAFWLKSRWLVSRFECYAQYS